MAGYIYAAARAALLASGLALLLAYTYIFNYAAFCNWNNTCGMRIALVGDPQIEGTSRVERMGWIGFVDNTWNDIFMRLVMSNTVTYLRPELTVVVGDIFSSQRILDGEFNLRVNRFNWIFSDVTNANLSLLSIVGNHDIGYGNEVTDARLNRFEAAFGPTNFVRWLIAPTATNQQRPVLSVVVNSQVLDPTQHWESHYQAWSTLHQAADMAEKHDAIVLLFTHIPLKKPNGSCRGDSFEVFKSSSGVIYEQTMLEQNTTEWLLQKLNPNFIFTGHDHEGCEYHHIVELSTVSLDYEESRRTKRGFNAVVPEYTIRSVMGDYSGPIGLFEFDPATGHSHFGYCPFMWIKALLGLVVAGIVWLVCALLGCILVYFCK